MAPSGLYARLCHAFLVKNLLLFLTVPAIPEKMHNMSLQDGRGNSLWPLVLLAGCCCYSVKIQAAAFETTGAPCLCLVKIGQSVANILRFFDFSRWRPPPSWIFEIAKFARHINFRWNSQLKMCPSFQELIF